MASNKISNRLVALSSAAILAVYVAGYERTSAAADRFATQNERRPIVPIRSNFVAPAQALERIIPGETPHEISAAGEAKQPETAAIQRAAPEGATPEGSAAALVRPDATPAAASANNETAPAAVSEPLTVAVPPTPAVPAIPAAAAPAAAQQALLKDGTYTGWGSCRHGDIQAAVVIESGRIASATIAQCFTRYPCSWISNAPGQVVSRQSIDVDYVSGATQSINAFRDAVFAALSLAK